MKNSNLGMNFRIAVSVPLILFSSIASAYVGPGAGLSALGSILALLGSFLLLIVGFIWYPIKRLLGRGRKLAQGPEASQDENHDARAEAQNERTR